MAKQIKRIGALLLAFAMILTMGFPSNSYAKTVKKTCVTRAYMLQQVEKLIGATETSEDITKVKDVKKGTSEYRIMSIALNAGLVKADKNQKLYPNRKATNNYVATVLGKVCETSTKEMLGKKNASAKLTKTGLKKYLQTRFPNVILESDATVTKGNVVINKPVTLSNAEIKGNLIIGDGVADKEVILNNVNVSGKLVVRGGGENSIIITGTSDISEIVVRQVNNNVSIKVRGDAKVSLVYINDGSNDVNIVGEVGTVNVAGKDLKVTLKEATVGSLTVDSKAKNSVVVTDKDSTIKEVNLNAAGTKIEGEGKVETVNVNANDTTVTVKDAQINTKEGVTLPKTGDKTDASDDNKKDDAKDDNGASSGGTSGGASGGSAGESTTPSTPDTPQVSTDARFADGYPIIKLDKESGSVSVNYKLKGGVASEEHPAEIYNLVSTANASFEATTESVIHGHLGVVSDKKHDIIYTEYSDYLKITDAEEHTVKYNIDSDGYDDGLVVYSVIDCNGVKSATPVREYFDSDTNGSFVRNSVSTEYGVFYSADSAKELYVYFYSVLNANKIPNPSTFSIVKGYENPQVVDGYSVEKAEIKVINNHSSYMKITLNKEIQNTDEEWYFKYKANGTNDIQDIYGNKCDKFSNEIIKASTDLEKVIRSGDGKYLHFDAPVSVYVDDYDKFYEDIDIYVNDKKVDRQNVSMGVSFRSLSVDVRYNGGDIPNKVELKTASGRVLYNAGHGSLVNLSTTTIGTDKEYIFDSASYNEEDGLVLYVSGISSMEDFNYYFVAGCNFEVKVGEHTYCLRGTLRRTQKDGRYCFICDAFALKHIDLSGKETVQIRYNPSMNEDNWEYESGRISYKSGKLMPASNYITVSVNK